MRIETHCGTCDSRLTETPSSPDEWYCPTCEVHRSASEVFLTYGNDDRIATLEAENEALRALLSRRGSLPTLCKPCALRGFGYSLDVVGTTLRCPNCGADALEESDA